MWLGQAFRGPIGWSADPDVHQQVHTGTVAYKMLRPVDVPTYWFMRCMPIRFGTLMLRATPILVVSYLVVGITLPPSVGALGAFCVSLVGALVLSSALATLVTISLLWTVSGDGISRMMPTITYALSGMAVPLPLVPDWFRPILEFPPFKGIIDTPFRFNLGHLPDWEIVVHTLHQLAWSLVLVLAGRLLFARGRHHLVVQGG